MTFDSGYEDLHTLLHLFERIAILFDEDYLDKNLFQSTLAMPFYSYYIKYISKLISIAKERGEPERHWMKPIENLAKSIEGLEEIEFRKELFFPYD